MIRIKRETYSENVKPSDLERCCFCEMPTDYWSVKRDVPVCRCCARLRAESDVPIKEHWIVFDEMDLQNCIAQ